MTLVSSGVSSVLVFGRFVLRLNFSKFDNLRKPEIGIFITCLNLSSEVDKVPIIAPYDESFRFNFNEEEETAVIPGLLSKRQKRYHNSFICPYLHSLIVKH